MSPPYPAIQRSQSRWGSSARRSAFHCCAKANRSASWHSHDSRSSRLPSARSNWSARSPHRRSSRWRTRGCSTNCATARATCRNRSNMTSISEVLQVISRSTFDLDAVLKTVVNAAARLCGVDHAGLYRDQDGEYCWAAGYNQSPEYERIERNVRIAPGPGTLVGRTAQQARPVQLSDAQTDPLYEPKQ